MLKLLEQEKGLAWVAHARTKGSTGYPDKYKDEAFLNRIPTWGPPGSPYRRTFHGPS
ncbi:hypothetical protein [Niabella hibiscisoli]|uniref:hypothetical protein n=1 Tax=Niabella hibiscisoli TaxID=1825928 RepID=UPI001F112A0E|nr:hypothetical protein [Niabella hibiscisoli]MCH5720746.1 hypothetical protein [Niabella hibiscisoli]